MTSLVRSPLKYAAPSDCQIRISFGGETKKIKDTFPVYKRDYDGTVIVETPVKEKDEKRKPTEFQEKGYITSDDIDKFYKQKDPTEWLDDFS